MPLKGPACRARGTQSLRQGDVTGPPASRGCELGQRAKNDWVGARRQGLLWFTGRKQGRAWHSWIISGLMATPNTAPESLPLMTPVGLSLVRRAGWSAHTGPQ